MDDKVQPQDDLFDYVNGPRLKNTTIPKEKADYGSFTILADKSKERVKSLIDEVAKKKFEERLRSVQSKKALINKMAELQFYRIGSPIGFFVMQGGKDARVSHKD